MYDRAIAIISTLAIIAIGLVIIDGRTREDPAPVIREVVVAESVFVRDTVRLRSILTRYDTVRVRDTIVVDNIVYVPRIVVDSVVAACRETVDSCERLVNAVRDSARVIGAKPWRSVGLEYPAGVYYEQDLLARLRAGASVGLDRDGRVRAALRFGIRWQ